MFFDIHVFGKTGCIGKVGAIGDIIVVVEIFHGFLPQLQALLKTAEGQPLTCLVKTVWPAKQSARSKRIAVLIISTIEHVLVRKLFVSGIVIDNRY